MSDGEVDLKKIEAGKKEIEILKPKKRQSRWERIASDLLISNKPKVAQKHRLAALLEHEDILIKLLRKAWSLDRKRNETIDLDTHGPISRFYLTLAVRVEDHISQPWFSNMITIAIIAAGILVGIETEVAIPGSNSSHPTLEALDNIILGIFTIDVVAKIISQGLTPWRYFIDPWNKFDFFIVFACYFFIVPILKIGVGSLIKMLRLLRLLRVLKLVKALPQLRIIIEALLSGFTSILFVALIIFMFFYLYANIGVILFRGNDPTNFGRLQFALITLFRIATLDNWSDVM